MDKFVSKYSPEHSAEVEILARDNSSNKVSAQFVSSYLFQPEAFSVLKNVACCISFLSEIELQ